MVRDTVKLGCVPITTLKRATSLGPGTTPPDQLPAVLKSVPLFCQVWFAASADCSGNDTARVRTPKTRRMDGNEGKEEKARIIAPQKSHFRAIITIFSGVYAQPTL